MTSPPKAPADRPAGPEPYGIAIVTWDAAADLPGCLAAVAELDPGPAELVVVDSGSTDGSPDVAESAWPAGVPGEVRPLGANLGFAAGMNAALSLGSAPWVLSLNADARPAPDFAARLLARAGAHPGVRVGAVTGRLVRPAAAGEPPRLDACGMRLTRSWRHLDRGSGEPDRGQLAEPQRVFGGTGAATLWRREALADAAVDGEVFDPRFHSYREDAELCFRLQERGWDVLYEPAAVAEHRRHNLPERRRRMSPAVNYHSLKNRYLLRIYHQTRANFWRTLPWALGRDLVALAWVLVGERSSLPAYSWLWRHRRELWARRRVIQERRRAPRGAVECWFRRSEVPL